MGLLESRVFPGSIDESDRVPRQRQPGRDRGPGRLAGGASRRGARRASLWTSSKSSRSRPIPIWRMEDASSASGSGKSRSPTSWPSRSGSGRRACSSRSRSRSRRSRSSASSPSGAAAGSNRRSETSLPHAIRVWRQRRDGKYVRQSGDSTGRHVSQRRQAVHSVPQGTAEV